MNTTELMDSLTKLLELFFPGFLCLYTYGRLSKTKIEPSWLLLGSVFISYFIGILGWPSEAYLEMISEVSHKNMGIVVSLADAEYVELLY